MSDCIVNVGFGQWHPKGSERLKRSLIYHGYAGHIQTWTKDLPPDCPPIDECPYGFKLAAIEWAKNQGHTRIMWLDSSVWAIRYPKYHLDAMAQDGYYLLGNGDWRCDQWTNAEALKYFGLTREEAREIPMISAGILGLDFANPIAGFFFERWKDARDAGAFLGEWTNSEWKAELETDDPATRYRGHRHDQVCASVIAHRLGMKIQPEETYDMYKRDNMPETVEFTLAGL